jgi:hypothetical protein
MRAFFSRLLGSRRIEARALGILDLCQEPSREFILSDTVRLTGLFQEVIRSTDRPPKCTALLLYCDLSPSGNITGRSTNLPQIIRESEAHIVIVATPNDQEACVAAAHKANGENANVVLTLDRKGESFSQFFASLFMDMKRGTTMPLAWHRLAPQGVSSHTACPETICLIKHGRLAFS